MRPSCWLSDDSFYYSSHFGLCWGKKYIGYVHVAFLIHGLSLWFIILIYSIWKANSLILNDRLFFFSVKKAMLTSLEEELTTVRGRAFFPYDSSGSEIDSKNERLFG